MTRRVFQLTVAWTAVAWLITPSSAQAQSITVTLLPAAVTFNLTSGSATNAGSVALSVTTAWTLLLPGRTISLYGYAIRQQDGLARPQYQPEMASYSLPTRTTERARAGAGDTVGSASFRLCPADGHRRTTFATPPTEIAHRAAACSPSEKSVNPRLSVLQVITRSSRQTSFNLGGEFLSNPLSVTVNYQTIYAPLRAGDPFVQVVGVDLRIHGPGGVELHAGTYATPDGHLKYTISGRQILSRAGRDNALGNRILKYQIRGLVVDMDAHPIAGAVVRIGRDIVITDEDGRFSLRTNKATRVEIAVLTDEFLAPGTFEGASAPAEASSGIEEAASEVNIVDVAADDPSCADDQGEIN